MKPFLTCIFVLVLASCSTSITKEELEATKNQKPEDLVPAGLLSKKNLDEEFPTEAPSPNLVEDVFSGQEITEVSSGNLPEISDEDLVWTDPDNPDENLGVVEQAFTRPVKDDWQLSYQSAQRLAYSEGKPLLIWFTDSARSPICKRLDSEVFNTHEFKKWSENNVILLRVDLSPRERESNLRKKKLKYAQALRKKFKISGNPTVLMIDFDGQSLGRYKGYKGGQGPFYLGRLEQAGKIITEQYFTWYPDLQKKRYRHWEGRNGVKLLAKLIHYNEGTLQVVEPNGRRTTFNEKNLSAKDQKWIAQEKKRRN